jgi:hypothetical protein
MARSKEDDELPPYVKYEVFKKAYGTLKSFEETQNYIGGFVLAFSILEDRTRAAVADCCKCINEPLNLNSLNRIGYKNLVDILSKINAIDADLAERLKGITDLRNNLTHQLMWRLGAFEAEHIKKVRKLINEVEKSAADFKKLHKA